jgi:hypothetical protein
VTGKMVIGGRMVYLEGWEFVWNDIWQDSWLD